LENGQVQQAITTMQELTALHPRYQEGQAVLQQLLAKRQQANTASQETQKQLTCGITDRAFN